MKITETLRAVVVKPADGGEWDDLGRVLRALRAPLHRVLNLAITDLEIAERQGRFAKGTEGSVPAQSESYRLVRDHWIAERAAAQHRVDAGKPYHGDEAIAATEPSGALVTGVAGAVFARWSKWRKEKWRGEQSMPTFGGDSPLYIASKGVAVKAEDGRAILDVSLTARGSGRTRMVLAVDGGASHAKLRRLLESDEAGDVKLVEERHDGKRKWMALISHSYEREERSGGATLALHRGVKCFLTAAVSGPNVADAYTTILETGDDIVRHQAAYVARRRSLGQQLRQIGQGAKGHGEKRRREHMTRLMDGDARWTESKCREVAAHALKLGERRGVTRVLVEDWGNPASEGAPDLGEHVERLVRRFPLAQLRACIEWGAKKRGWTVEIVPGDMNSRTCPKCEHVHEAPRGRAFLCERCSLERSTDVVYAWNMLRRDGQAVGPVIDAANRAAKRAGRKLRGAKAA